MPKRLRNGCFVLYVLFTLTTACAGSKSGGEASPGCTEEFSGQFPDTGGDTSVAPSAPDGSAGLPPCQLQVNDVVVGDGPEPEEVDRVAVHYSVALWETGEIVDSSWTGGGPITFPLGQGAVIQGFDQGLDGMKVGGRRQLIVPPEIGYGEEAVGPIPGGSTLIFTVDLLRVGLPEPS